MEKIRSLISVYNKDKRLRFSVSDTKPKVIITDMKEEEKELILLALRNEKFKPLIYEDTILVYDAVDINYMKRVIKSINIDTYNIKLY